MVNANGGTGDHQSIDARELEERKSDATSNETLSDLEDTEKMSSSGASEATPHPAPDGEFDKRDDGSNDPGPM